MWALYVSREVSSTGREAFTSLHGAEQLSGSCGREQALDFNFSFCGKGLLERWGWGEVPGREI